MNYYNEWDRKTAAWLRELIKEGHLPEGIVDARSITEVTPADLVGFNQCHFFAGIGGWPLALAMAGIRSDQRVWTGSCPCQPFSVAGRGRAQDDERHLWPAFFSLIRQCRPNVVFGEQVEGAIRHGWLDGVQRDLEGEGYAVGHAVLGAHSVGAPHQRQRLYWVAESVGDAKIYGRNERRTESGRSLCTSATNATGTISDTGCAGLEGCRLASSCGTDGQAYGVCAAGGAENAISRVSREGRGSRSGEASRRRSHGGHAGSSIVNGVDSAYSQSWGNTVINCRDGKHRRIPAEPAFFPLAHGVPARVVRLRGYGNAIVPQVAAEFVRAWCDCRENGD